MGGLTAASCAVDEPEERVAPVTSALGDAVAEVLEANGESLVYESISHIDPESGDVSVVSQIGAIDNETFQRFARPLAFDHEDDRVHFAAWRIPLEDGTIEEGTRITTTSPGPAVDTTPEPETFVDPRLVEDAEATEGDLSMMIRLRGFPDWDIPLVPDAAAVGVDSLAAALDAEAEVLAAREVLLDELGADVIELVGAVGGTIDHKLWSVGWLAVTVPVDALDAIATHPSVQTLTSVHAQTGMGQSREAVRPVEMTGEQAFWNDGQFGDTPNPAHGAGAIAVAVIEAGPPLDEARGFCQNASCSSTKFYRRYRCDQTGSFPCVITTNYPTSLENANFAATDHATTVATSAVADYLDDQLAGQTTAWKLDATSGPREAKLIQFGALGGWQMYPGFGSEVTFAEAFYLAANYNKADIVTGGTFGEFGPLNPNLNPPAHDCNFPSLGQTLAVYAYDMAAENAFDAGSFVAISPGNYCGASSTAFVSSLPAHLPKVFTASGLDMTGATCTSDYRTCQVDASTSSRGGAPAKIGSTTVPNALSEVDLLAPQKLLHFTRCSQIGNGAPCVAGGFVVTTGIGDWGTSFSAPRLGGYAALIKDWFLENNKWWFNTPGWLHVHMLGQTDAHFSTAPANPATPTTRKNNGADPVYGLGRVKLRHPDQLAWYGQDHRTLTFTNSSPVTFFVGNAPMPASAQIVKCVTIGHEDLSHKDNIGKVQLEVRLRGTVGGQCSASGTLAATRIDNSSDVKHMAAFRGSSVQVGGRCAQVTVRPMVLPTTGSVWTQTFCYFANEEDDAPN